MIGVQLLDVVVAGLAFVAMEGVTYLAHRFVMHGPGMGLHRSHHRYRGGRFEANDLYPLAAAAVTIATFAVATRLPGLRAVVAGAAGVTAYGFAYAFVHDLYTHRRFGLVKGTYRWCEWIKDNHELHHRFNSEPYGMLLPITVPRELRERAAATPSRAVPVGEPHPAPVAASPSPTVPAAS